jgi:putative membrane protein
VNDSVELGQPRDLPALPVLPIFPVLPLHDGQPLAPHDLWSAWSWEPVVVTCLVLSLWIYFRGLRALWRSAGPGHGIRSWEAAAFVAGWATLAIALVSPLHRFGEVLFTAHMAQHELLMVVAAPLLVLGRPIVPFLWAMPVAWRRKAGDIAAAAPVGRTWEIVTTAPVAWVLHGLAIWIWHAPPLYQSTITSETLHTLQHVSFLGTALLFWWALLHGREGRLGRPAAVIYLFTTAMHTSLLGVLLTFSDRLWYPLYDGNTAPWGLTALEDQQLAGLIMWVPAGLAYLVATLCLAASWLREPASRSLMHPYPLQ